ncbi:hypothetical protein EK21DRAFT_104235 [Setomelanomma holmii]|uniref:Uncharacterized protein n=1 Tax=Setomelanomma holmii TaxID=210430 RepID=A0A9P4LFZ5_9PLEO|nr:hypothetical protein EK21DRAFT_104235 [Setomelanomma holmii]
MQSRGKIPVRRRQKVAASSIVLRIQHGNAPTMKEAKRTPVPLPGSKAKLQPKSTPSKAPLSQEFVGSDDDSPAEAAPKPKKPKTTIAVHRPNGAAKAKAKEPTHDTETIKSTAKSKSSSKAVSSKPVVTTPQAVDTSSSEDTVDSDVTTSKEQKRAATQNGNTQGAASDSSSVSSSDESDESEQMPAAQKPAQTQVRAPQAHAVKFRSAPVYVPPKDFNAVPINDKTTSKSARIFEELHGKQIWHITAPAGVSMKDLKEIAMDSAMKEEAILEHKGTSYGFRNLELGADVACEVMTLHLEAVVKLPHLSSKQADPNLGSEAAASITRSTIRAPRPQLKGLKMRFRPTGFGNGAAGALGDSESEDELPQETAGLGTPDELNLPSRIRKEKRKHAEANGEASTEAPSKKPKKHRTAEEQKQKDEARRAKKEKKRAQEAALTRS